MAPKPKKEPKEPEEEVKLYCTHLLLRLMSLPCLCSLVCALLRLACCTLTHQLCDCHECHSLALQSPYMVNLINKTGLNKKQILKLLDQFKKIAADTKGKGKKKTTSVNGGRASQSTGTIPSEDEGSHRREPSAPRPARGRWGRRHLSR